MAVLTAILAFCSGNILYILLALSISIILYYWGVAPYRRSVLIAVTGDLPGPKPRPFVGHIHEFLAYKEQGHLCFQDYYKKYGRIYAMFFFGKPTIIVNDPEMIKQIMVKEFSSFHDRPEIGGFEMMEPFKSMMTMASGSTWQRIRNTMSPTFSTHKMKLMIPLMNASCDVLLKKLEDLAKTGESFNMHKFNQGLTMDTILKAAFGIHSDVQLDYEDPAFKAARKSINVPRLRQLVQIGVLLLPMFLKKAVTRLYPGLFFGHMNDIVDLTEQVIAAKKQQDSNIDHKDMLDMMLAAAETYDESKGLKEREVIAQSLIFLIAGYETTNTTLSFACHSLATNPEVQEKLQKEIDSVWTDEDEVPSYETVNQLPYLDMVLCETLRIFPPGFIVSRLCTQECIIKGMRFRKGVFVMTDVFSMHHDPEFYPDPEKFIPERFTAEAKQSRDPYTYLPFGQGPRNCVGMRFAQMEVKLALARVLKKYSFVATAETQIPPTVKVAGLLNCGDNMMLGVKARS